MKKLSEAEIAERRKAVKAGQHNCAMEGMPPLPEDQDLVEAYITGEMTVDEVAVALKSRIIADRAK